MIKNDYFYSFIWDNYNMLVYRKIVFGLWWLMLRDYVVICGFICL